MNKPQSKPLGHSDESGFKFSKEIMCGEPIFGINIDSILYRTDKNRYCVFELLRCSETQHVTPFTSDPNKYFFSNKERGIIGNGRKFEALWKITKALNAELYLINYADLETKHGDKVRIMQVSSVNRKRRNRPITFISKNVTRATYSRWFRNLNLLAKDSLNT